MSLKGVLVFLLSLLSVAIALLPEDRVSTLLQTQHAGWKTPWMDIALNHMPKFKVPDSAVIQATLPHPLHEQGLMPVKLNPDEDVKVSLTFAGHKLLLPWVLLYDSNHRKSLTLLTVTFYHDDFEILRLGYKTTYGPPIGRLDPSHPSLTAFKIVYQWEAVHEDDVGMGVFTMFLTTLAMLFFMIIYISCSYDRDSPVQPSKTHPYPSEYQAQARGAGITTSSRRSFQ